MSKILDMRFKKTAGVKDNYGEDYINQHGEVTLYHILFKDFGDQIGAMSREEAIQFVSDKANELQANFNGDPDYSDSNVEAFLSECEQSRDGMEVLFKIKDFLIATEDDNIIASINTILKHPKIASKASLIIKTMLQAHHSAINNKNKN